MQLEWILAGLVVIALIYVIISSRKKRWYKVYLANNDVLLLYKTVGDFWFREGSGKAIFRYEDGRVVVFPDRGHWIAYYVEVRDVEAAKRDIEAINRKKAELED